MNRSPQALGVRLLGRDVLGRLGDHATWFCWSSLAASWGIKNYSNRNHHGNSDHFLCAKICFCIRNSSCACFSKSNKARKKCPLCRSSYYAYPTVWLVHARGVSGCLSRNLWIRLRARWFGESVTDIGAPVIGDMTRASLSLFLAPLVDSLLFLKRCRKESVCVCVSMWMCECVWVCVNGYVYVAHVCIYLIDTFIYLYLMYISISIPMSSIYVSLEFTLSLYLHTPHIHTPHTHTHTITHSNYLFPLIHTQITHKYEYSNLDKALTSMHPKIHTFNIKMWAGSPW